MQVQPRQIAIRASVSDVIEGEFVDKERDRKVISPHGVQMKRVALVGFIISKYLREADGEKKRFESVTIDDGTGTIQLKVWGDKNMFKHVKDGILVLVVGRVSKTKNSDEVYINPDFIKELTDPNFMSLHLLERYRTILKRTGIQLPDTSQYQQMTLDSSDDFDDDDVEPEEDEPSPKPIKRTRKKSTKPKVGGFAGEILAYIQKNVNPDGVAMKDIVAHFEKKGKKSKDIQMKVFDLVGEEIDEVSASHYLPSDM
jgi:RPA family protein